jgi:tRNA threonylcarbamoyladenosine biosynthesis protein TsaB
MILNIESATDMCSVSISDGNRTLALAEIAQTNQHAAKMTRLIESVLNETGLQMQDISAVAVSNGPGSYTSLRVGISTAKGVCFARKIPLIAVDTLAALADAAAMVAPDADFFIPMIDARRMEVYCAIFEKKEGKITRNAEIKTFEPRIIDENSFKNWFDEGKKIAFCGNGAAKCAAVLNYENAIFLTEIVCSATHLAIQSHQDFVNKKFVDVAYHVPEYGKMPNITTPKKLL